MNVKSNNSESASAMNLPSTDGYRRESVLAADAPLPGIHSGPQDPTVPNLRIIDIESLDEDESVGFDPYNTAVLFKK